MSWADDRYEAHLSAIGDAYMRELQQKRERRAYEQRQRKERARALSEQLKREIAEIRWRA